MTNLHPSHIPHEPHSANPSAGSTCRVPLTRLWPKNTRSISVPPSAYAAHCRKLMEENANGLGDIHAEYYYIGMYVDLARMEAFAWKVVQALYRVLRDDYKGFEEAYNKRPDLFLHADLRKMNGLVERYARCNDAAAVREMMKEYCGLLIEI